jgi:glutamate synthase (NADPH/NADH) large chain
MASLGFRRFDEMVGRVDILRCPHDVTHWKAKELHLSALLHTPNAPHGDFARHYVQPQTSVWTASSIGP